MGGQDDLDISIQAIMAARREELGGPPTPEELLAYRDDQLSPEQRRKVEAQLAVYPDAARALADLRAFPAVEPAPGTPELSGDEIDARWQAFHCRLMELPSPALAENAPPGGFAPAAAWRRSSGVRAWPAALRLAVAALVALAVGWTAGLLTARATRDRLATAVNVQIAELAPAEEGSLRSAAPAVEMPPSAEELLLVLAAPGVDKPGPPEYQAEVVDDRGRTVWSLARLRPSALGTFQLSFRRGALASGRYLIRLYGLYGSDRRRGSLLTTYDLRLRAALDAR